MPERVGRAIGFPTSIRIDQDAEFMTRDPDLRAYQHSTSHDRASRPITPSSNRSTENSVPNAHWFMSENARLGVETTTKSDHTARSATKPRLEVRRLLNCSQSLDPAWIRVGANLNCSQSLDHPAGLFFQGGQSQSRLSGTEKIESVRAVGLRKTTSRAHIAALTGVRGLRWLAEL